MPKLLGALAQLQGLIRGVDCSAGAGEECADICFRLGIVGLRDRGEVAIMRIFAALFLFFTDRREIVAPLALETLLSLRGTLG